MVPTKDHNLVHFGLSLMVVIKEWVLPIFGVIVAMWDGEINS